MSILFNLGWSKRLLSIPIKEADREKTSFITPRGQFEFNVMPFGLCNAPATYQRAIDSALKDATESLPYIDDTLTFSHSFEEHLQHLHQVLGCYRVAIIQLRRDKCSFGFEEIKFLGHLLSKRGHEPLPSLVDKIQEQARPGNLKDLRSFLGLVNYYRDFIPHMAERAAPLYGLTKKGVKFSWDLSCEESFASLCKTLSQNPVTLAYPDWVSHFTLRRCLSGRYWSCVSSGGRQRENEANFIRILNLGPRATKLQYRRKGGVGNCSSNTSMEEVLAGCRSSYYLV